MTQLIRACDSGHVNIVKVLINNESDVNDKNKLSSDSVLIDQ